MPTKKMPIKKTPIFWLHALTVLLGLAVCTVLLLSSSGHPPGIVFMPLALAAWLITHLFLGFIQLLVSQGAKRASAQAYGQGSWPIALIIVVLACGLFSLIWLGGMVSWWLSNEAWRSHRSAYLVVEVVTFSSLVGILLRQRWGLIIAGVACIVVSGHFMYKVASRINSGYAFDSDLAFFALGYILVFGLFGCYLLRSRRIRSFFEHHRVG